MQMHEDIPKGLRLNDLGGAEIVSGRFRDHRFPRHSHDGLMLSIVHEGAQKIKCRGETHVGGRGVVIAVPPNEAHTGEPQDENGWCYQTITIPRTLIEKHSGAKNSHFFCETAIKDPELINALSKLFLIFGKTGLLCQEEVLMSMLRRFMQLHTNEVTAQKSIGTEARVVETCKEFLVSRIDQNVSLADLQEVAGIDQFRIVKIFTKVEGLPPHAWHLQYRLRVAQDMLSRGKSVVDATYASGFADQSHLSRAFKKLTGITPGAYRKTHLTYLRS